MRVCFLTVAFQAWGKMTGSGTATRILARELAQRGVEVYAVTPRRKGQKPVEYVDGVTVLSFPKYSFREQMKIYKRVEADIYHSQNPSVGTWLAMRAMPKGKHVITCRDPRNLVDWYMYLKSDLSEFHLRALGGYFWENSFLAARAARKADAVFCPAKFQIKAAQKQFRLARLPEFVPHPINISGSQLPKSEKPTVCFVGRWIKAKRPELFFELAREFPEVTFIAMGKAETPRRDSYLREKYGSIPNLEMVGWIDRFSSASFEEILSKSWILVNTGEVRAAVPVPFVEAASFKCAILSSIDPDGFASQFGYWAKEGDFDKGLRFLLSNDEWLIRGQRAYDYVSSTSDLDLVVSRHMQVYSELLWPNSPNTAEQIA